MEGYICRKAAKHPSALEAEMGKLPPSTEIFKAHLFIDRKSFF
jgi:hypothetical protein